MDDVLESVRRLHRPYWHRPYTGKPEEQAWLTCRGCDEGAHAESPPSWPCQTADLVYSPEEIAAREPRVPECPEDHRTIGEGPPVRAPAVFAVRAGGALVARRFRCDHVTPVPVTSSDPWE